MAARGNVAKEKLIKKFTSIPGVCFLGEYDRKYYFEEDDGGERVQIALTLTCPKTPIEVATNVEVDTGNWDFSDDAPVTSKIAVASAGPAEITDEEISNLQALMEKLGL